MPSRKQNPSPEALAIAAEIKQGRGVDPDTGRGKLSRDKLSVASGVGLETLKWIEEAKSARPDDAHSAAFYDALGLTPEAAPHLALARARWALDPRRPGGLEAATAALESVASALLAPLDPTQRVRSAAQAEARRRAEDQPASPSTHPAEGEEG